MGLLGSAVLAFWNDIAPGGDPEFLHWHTREHVPERVGVEGFLRGRRYVAIAGEPRYFTLYETESVETLQGSAYLARLNAPTPWTRRALPLFRNSRRTVCRVTLSLGNGVGGVLAALEFGPAPAREEALRAWLASTALPAAGERPGVVGAHLCEAEERATRIRTEETRLRDRPDALARWVILLEAIGPEALESACGEVLSAETLARHGATEDSALGIYRLQYCLGRE